MDLTTILGGVAILLLGITPFALMHINTSRKEQKMLQGLSELAVINNGAISSHELWNNSAIGIDDLSQMVYYTHKKDDFWITQQIHLAEIQKCRIVNSTRTAATQNGSVQVIERLALAFDTQTGSEKELLLEFYNADHDGLSLKGELQLVEKWCKIINDKLAEMHRK